MRARGVLGLLAAIALAAVGCGPKGGGGSGSQPRYPRFAYVPNAEVNTVSVYQVLAPTGRLRPLGYMDFPVAVLGMKASGSSMLVQHQAGTNIFQIDGPSGFLGRGSNPLPSCPFPVLLSADGGFIFCLDRGAASRARAFRLDTASGVTTELGSAPVVGELLAVDPQLRFLLVGNYGQSTITPIKLDLGNAANPVSAAAAPWSIGSPAFAAIEPSGRWAYVAAQPQAGSWALVMLAMRADGTPAGAPLQTLPLPGKPNVMKLGRAGTELFVGGPTAILSFMIDAATGMLSPSGRTFPAGTPTDIGLDPGGRFVYPIVSPTGPIEVVDLQNAATARLVDAFRPVWRPVRLEITEGAQAVTTSSKFLLVSDVISNVLRSFAIDWSNGTLKHVADAPTGGAGAAAIAVSRDGRFAYVTSIFSNQVTAFAIDPVTGRPTLVNAPVTLPGKPLGVAVDRSTRFLFVPIATGAAAGLVASEIVSLFADPMIGALGPIVDRRPLSAVAPSSIAVSNNGDMVLVTDGRGTGQLDLFELRPNVLPASRLPFLRPLSIALPTGTQPPPPGTLGAMFDPLDRYVAAWGASSQVWPLNRGTLGPASAALPTSFPINTLASTFNGGGVPFGTGVFAITEDGFNRVGGVADFGVGPGSAGPSVSKRWELPFDPAIAQPVAARADASGQWLYVLDRTARKIFLFDRDRASGALPQVTTAGAAGTPLTRAAPRASYVTGAVPWDMQIVDVTN